MTRIRITRIAIFLGLSAISLALEVSPNSPCAAKCIDDPRTGDVANRSSSLTFSTDLFCYDWEIVGINSTQNGQKLKDCNNCLKSSGYGTDDWPEIDRGWFMFNNRAIVDWCLFGRFAEENNPNKTETSIYKTCNRSCNILYNAADYQVKSNPDSYNFCDNSGNFTSDADSCLQCLYGTPGLTILGNVLTTVVDMCHKKPGKVYNFPKDQEIYAATRISLSITPTAQASSSASMPSSSNPASSSESSSGLSRGALAGIVLGALIGIALILGGILLLFRHRKNKKKISELSSRTHENTKYGHAGHQHSAVGKIQGDVQGYQPELMAQERVELPGDDTRGELPARHSDPSIIR